MVRDTGDRLGESSTVQGVEKYEDCAQHPICCRTVEKGRHAAMLRMGLRMDSRKRYKFPGDNLQHWD